MYTYHTNVKSKKDKKNLAKPSLSQSTEKRSDTRQYSAFFPQHLLPIFLISILSLAIYSNTVRNGFVYDDEVTVTKNSFIRSLSNLPKLVQMDYFAGSGEGTYRPVVTFTYFIDYALFGPSPWGYHLANIVLHAINGALFYIFLILLLGKRQMGAGRFHMNLPLLMALVFATHPVLTEAVNGVSFREDLLAFLFYLSALNIYLYIRTTNTSFCHSSHSCLLFIASCLLLLFALLSKEMAVTFFLVVYCYEAIYGDNNRDVRSTLFNPYNLGYIAVTLIYIVLRFYIFHNPTSYDLANWPLYERLITMPCLIMNYLALTLFPLSLSADYAISPLKSVFEPVFALSLIVIISLLIFSVRLWKREKGILFGILFFIVTIVPVLNLVPLANPFAERYLYLPAAGLIMGVGLIIILIPDIMKSSSKAQSLSLLILFLVVISINSLVVVKRNAVWRDNYSLWFDTVNKMPASSRAHYNLGIEFFNQGRLDEAIREYLTALKINPNYIDAHNNLGTTYAQLGRLDDSIKEFLTVITLKHDHAEAHNNLGNAYYSQGRLDESLKEYLTAVDLNPDYLFAHFNLGNDIWQRA